VAYSECSLPLGQSCNVLVHALFLVDYCPNMYLSLASESLGASHMVLGLIDFQNSYVDLIDSF